MRWKDPRLTFANLIPSSENKVTPETVEELWIPVQYVTYENALIDEIHPASKKEVEIMAIRPSNAMKSDYAIQNTLYEGAHNIVAFKQRYRLIYKCTFSLRYFPFDTQTCTFIMKMESDKFSTVSFEKDQDRMSGNRSAVRYVGPECAKEFRIDTLLAHTGITGKHTYFNFTIKFERMYTDQLIETFFPTILLLSLIHI